MIYRVNYEIAKEVWKQDLWSYGNSADKKYSKMKIKEQFDKTIAEKTIFYWAYKLDDKIVGINSGYKSCDNYYRSRGLWVDPKFRGAGFAKSLLDVVIGESIFWGCKYIWSYPREESLSVYESMGFKKQGEFEVGTYGFNCVAVKENV
mgnify:CR=1 FL=1|tara:strand:- start:6507 stop:6950 length:444 start_codon:yes stop_codon:yes gene_type:complete